MLRAVLTRTTVRPALVTRTPVAARAFLGDSVEKPQRAKSVRRSQSATRATEGKKAPKPDTVARAPTAFQLYTKDHFRRVMAANPDVKTIGDRLKLVRTEWTNLPKDQQAPYEQQAAQLKAAVVEKRATILEEKKKNARPISAYLLFCNDNRQSVMTQTPGIRAPEVLRQLGAAWRALPEDEKAVYQTVAKEAVDKWSASRPAKA